MGSSDTGDWGGVVLVLLLLLLPLPVLVLLSLVRERRSSVWAEGRERRMLRFAREVSAGWIEASNTALLLSPGVAILLGYLNLTGVRRNRGVPSPEVDVL